MLVIIIIANMLLYLPFLCCLCVGRYGRGTYFAVDSSLSAKDLYSTPNEDGIKSVFLCRVITGIYIQGKPKLVTAPICESKSIKCHSVDDDVESPTIFVSFQDGAAYASI